MGTHATGWTQLLAANSTDADFDTVVPTTSPPAQAATLALIDMGDRFGPDLLQLKFYGTDAANEAFSARVWGWTECEETATWEPVLLAELLVTLGSIARGSNHFDADTLVVTYGNTDLVNISAPANDLPAYAVIDPLGQRWVTVEFNLDTAAAANGMYRRIRGGGPA